MQSNINFKSILTLSYLALLAEHEYTDEFGILFSKIEWYLKEVVENSTNKELLEKAKKIIDFREMNKQVVM